MYPGQNVTVDVVIVGELYGTIPGSLKVNNLKTKQIFTTHNNCTPVTFTAYATTGSEATFEFELFSAFNSSFTISQSKKLTVNFTTCPKGFDFNETLGQCDCYNWGKIECDFTTLSLKRSPPAWVGFLDTNEAEVVYQNECPFNYCNENKIPMHIVKDTFDSDKQCSPNRTGFLCGACVENFSISASSPSFCMDCTGHSSVYVVLYVVGQLCYGIALVLLLTIGNWTITDGTMSCFIFYANIFKLNMFLFFPNRLNVITVILSLVNLDFYFTECLYNGLDAYTKAWLSFLFPVYMWALIVAIIYLCRYCNCLAKLFGESGVKILATLIELSYAGLTRAVIVTLSPISITISQNHSTVNSTTLRWIYDPNIVYLDSKHLPLFLVGIVFGLLLLAYTLILLLVQPLQRYSHLPCFRWVAKLKPLIDAYTSPHIIKRKCQFWPGLLLLVRLILIIIFAGNVKMHKNSNLAAIASGCLFLAIVAWGMGGIYTKAFLNILNSFFIINLGVLALFVNFHHKKYVTVSYVSASLSILAICLVLFGHVALMVKKRVCRRRGKVTERLLLDK